MGNLTTFSEASVPASIAKLFAELGGNEDLSSGVSGGFAVISYRGKVWRLVKGGDATILTNKEGDPRQSLEIVILKANANLSKLYYEAGYEEGSNEKPTCYSHDGKVPAADAAVKQHDTCGGCPHNQWGSRISETDKKGKACADFRRMAVAPAGALEDPMLLRVPAASLRELSTYADMLNKRGVPYQAVTTKISFDVEVAYPKMIFTPTGWLDDAQLDKVKEVMGSDIINQITGIEVANTAPAPAPAPDPLAALGPRPGAVEPTAKPATKSAAPVIKPPKHTAKPDAFASAAEEPQVNKASEAAAQVLDEMNSDPALSALLAALDD